MIVIDGKIDFQRIFNNFIEKQPNYFEYDDLNSGYGDDDYQFYLELMKSYSKSNSKSNGRCSSENEEHDYYSNETKKKNKNKKLPKDYSNYVMDYDRDIWIYPNIDDLTNNLRFDNLGKLDEYLTRNNIDITSEEASYCTNCYRLCCTIVEDENNQKLLLVSNTLKGLDTKYRNFVSDQVMKKQWIEHSY